MQHAAERLAKGNARFFNLAMGDKVLLKDNFRTSNVFAKANCWTPVRVTEIFPSGDGAVRTVTVQKENSDKQTLTTDKLAIVDEDLLDWYRLCVNPLAPLRTNKHQMLIIKTRLQILFRIFYLTDNKRLIQVSLSTRL
jgi:hypothetical protein